MAETAVTAPSAASAAPAVRLASVWLTTLALGEDGEQARRRRRPRRAVWLLGLPRPPSPPMLLAILFGEPFRPRQAAAIGQALVRGQLRGRRRPRPVAAGADACGCPNCSTEYLRLPRRARARAARRRGDRGAMANGYVHALRDRTLAEQESLMRAELDAQRIISDRLMHEATHDPLTGLPNRAAVFDQALRRARRRQPRQRRPLLRGPRRLQGDQRPLRSPGGRRTARHGVQAHLRDRHRLRRARRAHRRRRVRRRGGGISWHPGG